MLKCPNCGGTNFALKGTYVTEYHDAAIPFRATLTGSGIGNLKKEIEGSYYLDNLSVTCTTCKHKIDLENLSDLQMQRLYELLDRTIDYKP